MRHLLKPLKDGLGEPELLSRTWGGGTGLLGFWSSNSHLPLPLTTYFYSIWPTGASLFCVNKTLRHSLCSGLSCAPAMGQWKCSSKQCCHAGASSKGDWCLPPHFSATGRGQTHPASASVLCPAPESQHLGPAVVGKVSFYPPLSWGQEENQLSADRILGNAVYQLLLSICNHIFFFNYL